MTSFKNMLRAAALGVAMIATAAAVPNQASAADRSDVIAGVAGGLLLGTLFAAAANASNNSYAAPVQTYQAPRQTYIAPAFRCKRRRTTHQHRPITRRRCHSHSDLIVAIVLAIVTLVTVATSVVILGMGIATFIGATATK